MGILDAPATDWRRKPLAQLRPTRDLPGTLAHWDTSLLSAAAGATLSVLPDTSGNGNHLRQPTVAARPTVATHANGLKYLALGATGYVTRATLANGDWLAPVTLAQPISFAFVIRLPSGSSVTANRYIAAMGGILVATGTATGSATANAGSSIAGGPNLADGKWHVIAGVISATGTAVFLDGQLVGSILAAGAGTGTFAGIAIGGSFAGANPLNGDFAEGIIASAAWTPQQLASVSASLGAKWGATIGTAQAPPDVDPTTASGNGQPVRIWEPPNLAAGAPLVLYCHNYTGTEAITAGAGVWMFPLVMASLAEGWRVAASRQHGDSWGNQNALDDVVDLFTTMNARQAVTKVILVGASMGGLSASLLVPDGRLPVKGVYLIDAVTNLLDVYNPTTGFTNYSSAVNTAYGIVAGTLAAGAAPGSTTLSSSVSYPAGTVLLLNGGSSIETVTVAPAGPSGSGPYTLPLTAATTKTHNSGVAVRDYPSKTSGHDPNVLAGSAYTGVRWHFMSSLGDTSNVSHAQNIDLMAAKVAAAPEAAVVTHLGPHLAADAAQPADFVAFVKRCLA